MGYVIAFVIGLIAGAAGGGTGVWVYKNKALNAIAQANQLKQSAQQAVKSIKG